MINLINQFKNLYERGFSGEIDADETPLCVMNDRVFKKILSSDTEDSREALRHLLSACTRREVKAVKIMNNEILPAYHGGKSPRLDVRVNFNDGEAADIEMQINKSDDDLKKRAVHYAASLQFAQAKKGFKYDDIKKVYQIFFLNHVIFSESAKLPRRYSYREEMEHDLLTNASEIIIYEMPKLDSKVNDYITGKIGIETLSAEEKWCIFFRYHHEQQAKSLIQEICKKEEGIMRAEKQVDKLPRSYIRFMTVEMDKIKNNIDRALMYEAGHEKGLAKGHEEEKIIIAQGLLAKGSTMEFTSEITGLSIEQIKLLT